MGGRSLVIAVPFSYVRADTILPRYRTLGHVIINDPAALDGEIEPLLLDHVLDEPVFGNLTLGFYSGQAPSHPSVLKYNVPHNSDKLLSSDLLDWAVHQGVSDAVRPTPTQVLSLIETVGIPLKFGRPVLHDVLTRVLGKIKTLRPRPAGTPPSGGLSYPALVQAALSRLHSSGKLRAAVDVFLAGSVTAAAIPQDSISTPTPPRFTASAATPRYSSDVGRISITPGRQPKTSRPVVENGRMVTPPSTPPNAALKQIVTDTNQALRVVTDTARSELGLLATDTQHRFSKLNDRMSNVNKSGQATAAEVGKLKANHVKLTQYLERLTSEYLGLEKQYAHTSGPAAVQMKEEMDARFAQLEKCIKLVAYVVQSQQGSKGVEKGSKGVSV